MNQKTAKLLRKYRQYRGKGMLNIRILKNTFEKADTQMQKEYIKEISGYIRAVDEGRINPGDLLK